MINIQKQDNTNRTGQNPYAEGSRYYDLWANNPYTMDKMTQKQTAWDKVANFFGFRSAYDTAVDQRMQAAAEYDAQISQLKGEDEYNSAQAQAQRMKTAGENPDLLGVEGGGTAAEFAMEQTTPEVTPDENLTRIGALANGIVQAVSLATGLTTDIGATMQIFQNLRNGDLQYGQNIEGLATKFFQEWTPDETTDWREYTNGKTEQEQLTNFMRNQARVWAEHIGIKGRNKKQFVEAVVRRTESDKEYIFNKWRNNESARQEWGKKKGSRYFTGNADLKEIAKIMQPLTNVMDDYLEYHTIAQSEKAKDEAQEAIAYSGTIEGEKKNEVNKAEKDMATFNREMKKAYKDVMDGLTKKAEEGDTFAWIMTLILPGVYSQIMGK